MKNLINNYYNYVLFAAVLSWCIAQILKTIINILLTKEFNPERLIGAGGMPSSHSALVCSATVALSRKVGITSPEFAIMFIIAIVVMYDAMGVRRAAGMHAKEINKINKNLEENSSTIDVQTENKFKELKEFLGHTPYEVIAGALLGIIIALMVPFK